MKKLSLLALSILAATAAGPSAAAALDFSVATASVAAIATDALPMMSAIIAVAAAFWGFGKIKSLLSR